MIAGIPAVIANNGNSVSNLAVNECRCDFMTQLLKRIDEIGAEATAMPRNHYFDSRLISYHCRLRLYPNGTCMNRKEPSSGSNFGGVEQEIAPSALERDSKSKAADDAGDVGSARCALGIKGASHECAIPQMQAQAKG